MFDGFSPDHQLSVKELIFGGCIRKGGWQGASLRNFSMVFKHIIRFIAMKIQKTYTEEEGEEKKEKKKGGNDIEEKDHEEEDN